MKLNNYEGKVKILPKEQTLACDLTMKYVVKEDEIDTLDLYLYRSFVIEDIKSDDIESYIFEEQLADLCHTVRESRRLKLKLSKTYTKGDVVVLNLSYHGQIGIVSDWEVNRMSEEFVELGLYTPWFPLSKSFEMANFDLKVHLPEEYKLINASYKDGVWHIVQDYPFYSCTLIASKEFKSYVQENRVSVYYMKDHLEILSRKIFDGSIWTLNYFTNLFGKLKVEKTTSIVFLSRNIGGGYCRPGLIVFQEPEIVSNKKDIKIHYLAHELSHLWWNKSCDTNSYEDWLNEAFAEYSALMAVREREGIDKFKGAINKYEERTQDLPPIYGINRDHEKAYSVLYEKGALVLYNLEQKIGNARFLNFLRFLHEQSINNTNDLLDLLTSLEGEEISNYLLDLLKK